MTDLTDPARYIGATVVHHRRPKAVPTQPGIVVTPAERALRDDLRELDGLQSLDPQTRDRIASKLRAARSAACKFDEESADA